MLEKIEGRRRRGQQRMRWLHDITSSMDRSMGRLWEMVKDRRPGMSSPLSTPLLHPCPPHTLLFSHSVMSSSVTLWTVAHQASLFCIVYWSLLKLMSVESMMPSNHLILHHSLLLPSVFSSIRVFSNESALGTRGPKYWRFSFSISPSIEYSGLISFRMDWFDFLAVQGTLKSLL